MAETITTEQRAEAMLPCKCTEQPHASWCPAHYRPAVVYALREDMAIAAKVVERTAQREFFRLPFGQFALAQEVSMAAAKAISLDATLTTEPSHDR